MRAIIVDSSHSERLVLDNVNEPVAGQSEVVVAVEAVSLNPGELRFCLSDAPHGWRPGWDFAGRVVAAAADGSGPAYGARVVGFMENGAWAERVAVASSALAVVPDSISIGQAATLPVAGLTALHALAEGGLLVGSRVLVTAASGGVGRFACQLARAAGAHVTATVRREALAEAVSADGAHKVLVTSDVSTARRCGPYDLVLDSLGGQAITAALGMLNPGGACVVYGVANSDMAPISIPGFMRTGGARLVGFFLYQSLKTQPAGIGLGKLLTLMEDGRLHTAIELETSWKEIAALSREVIGRGVSGKVVLHVGDGA